jgi:hypothetical protein
MVLGMVLGLFWGMIMDMVHGYQSNWMGLITARYGYGLVMVLNMVMLKT